jgi:hypothetical protein
LKKTTTGKITGIDLPKRTYNFYIVNDNVDFYISNAKFAFFNETFERVSGVLGEIFRTDFSPVLRSIFVAKIESVSQMGKHYHIRLYIDTKN